MIIKYLRNVDAKLHECITAIRKEERDQLRKRAEKRKLQSTLRRYKLEETEEKEKKNHETKITTSSPNKRARRLNGIIETTNAGTLTIPNDQWRTLDADDKAFIQNYNSKIKLQESVAGIKVPDGVTIRTKSRRNQGIPDEDEQNDEDTDETPPQKKQKKGKKKVHFSVEPSAEDSE